MGSGIPGSPSLGRRCPFDYLLPENYSDEKRGGRSLLIYSLLQERESALVLKLTALSGPKRKRRSGSIIDSFCLRMSRFTIGLRHGG